MRSAVYIVLGTLLVTGCVRSHRDAGDTIVQKNYIHRYGIEVTQDDWDARGGNGQIVTKQRDGITVVRSYRNGKLNGPTTHSYIHSDLIARTEEFRDNELVKETKHYPSGLPKEEVTYLSKTDKTTALWHETGAPWMKERYSEDKLVEGDYYGAEGDQESRVVDGNGERVMRDAFGAIISRDLIQNGEMITQTTYHPNENPKEVIPYSGKTISGLRLTFLPDGEPNTAEEWQNGVQDGITTLFQNGEKIAEIPYVQGIKNGVERRYTGGTQVVEEITWVNGTKHGPYQTYLGSEVRMDWYYQGKQVNKAAYDLLSRQKGHAAG